MGGSFTQSGNFFSPFVLLARPNETFSAVSPQREIDFEPSSLLVRDIDTDGKPDLIAAHCCGELSTRVYAGRGDGTFTPAFAIPTGQDTTRLWLADFDDNGAPELVAQNPAGSG